MRDLLLFRRALELNNMFNLPSRLRLFVKGSAVGHVMTTLLQRVHCHIEMTLQRLYLRGVGVLHYDREFCFKYCESEAFD